MATQTQLVYAIIKFLDEQSKSATEETAESIEVARQCLETAYGVSLDDEAKYSLPAPLEQIFNKGLQQFPQGLSQEGGPTGDQSKALAEKCKVDGNESMRAEKFQEALQHYSKAVEADPTNAVYFCNRAAAYSKLEKHQEALEDCIQALNIDPGYSKAYGRKGLAHTALGQHDEAVQCYRKALELDPGNATYQQNLEIADQKLRQGGTATGGMPGAPGNLDFTSLFSNPALMNMATNMMANPEMQQLMSGLMSGAQQQPTGQEGFAGLLQAGQRLAQQLQQSNPDLVEQLRTQMNRPGNDENGTQ